MTQPRPFRWTLALALAGASLLSGCIVVPAGHRIVLTVRGRDHEYQGPIDAARNARHRYPSRGCGPFRHDDPEDRANPALGGRTRVHTGPDHPSSLLMPIIPQH